MTQHICSRDLRPRSWGWSSASRVRLNWNKNPRYVQWLIIDIVMVLVLVLCYIYMGNNNILHCVVAVVLFKCYWFPISKIVVVIATRVLYTQHSEWETSGPLTSLLVRAPPPSLSPAIRSEWRTNLYGRIICLISERQIAVITRLHAMNESTTYLCRIGL